MSDSAKDKRPKTTSAYVLEPNDSCEKALCANSANVCGYSVIFPLLAWLKDLNADKLYLLDNHYTGGAFSGGHHNDGLGDNTRKNLRAELKALNNSSLDKEESEFANKVRETFASRLGEVIECLADGIENDKDFATEINGHNLGTFFELATHCDSPKLSGSLNKLLQVLDSKGIPEAWQSLRSDQVWGHRADFTAALAHHSKSIVASNMKERWLELAGDTISDKTLGIPNIAYVGVAIRGLLGSSDSLDQETINALVSQIYARWQKEAAKYEAAVHRESEFQEGLLVKAFDALKTITSEEFPRYIDMVNHAIDSFIETKPDELTFLRAHSATVPWVNRQGSAISPSSQNR